MEVKNQVRLYHHNLRNVGIDKEGRPLALVVTVQRKDKIDTPLTENPREIKKHSPELPKTRALCLTKKIPW